MTRAKVERLINESDSRYYVVIAAARRARQINDYFGSVRRHEQAGVLAPNFGALSEKPLSIAFKELAEGKITFEMLDRNSTE